MTTPPLSDERGGPPLLADRYELGTTLGRGGMADVYRAVDRLLGRAVAVKMLRETTAEESDRARFIDEARTLARLSHSGLVTILDAGFGSDAGAAGTAPGLPPAAVAPDQPFLVMELIDGPSLSQTIAQGPLPLDEVASIGVQVADALGYVHGQGIIHRDVKPGNVLLGPGRQVKLADFGIARLLDGGARHTRTGQAIGTAAYLAPEQVTGQELSGATDVYSLGLVLLEALTGRREYPGSATESAIARLHRPPQVPDDLPTPWRQLLQEMTEQDPVRRPDAAAVAERLREEPTAPMPVPVAGEDAAQATSVLNDTSLAAGTPPAGGRTSVIDRAGDSLARQPRALADRFRAMSSSQRGVFGAIAALVVVLLLLAIVGTGSDTDDGGTGPTEVPSDAPSELRQPLQDLHDAVHGDAE